MIQRSRQTASETKALHHQILGAGRNRTKREFLGLTPQDEKDITTRIEQHIGRQLKVK